MDDKRQDMYSSLYGSAISYGDRVAGQFVGSLDWVKNRLSLYTD